MPRCDKCQYLTYEGYEYKEYYCKIFGYDTPDKYLAFEGEGCRCTQKFLKKLYEKEVERDKRYWEQETKNIGEYMRYLEVDKNEKLN